MARLQSRCTTITELTGHLGRAARAVAATDAVVEELAHDLQVSGEVGCLQRGLAVVREVVDLARP
jgi:hypothetical protein